MKPDENNPDIIVDFITGQSVPHVGPEINRQRVERYLVEERGYHREEILVDAPIAVDIDGETYRSTVDLVVRIDERPLIAIKCAAGSLGSREREIVSAARLLTDSPLPLAVVSDGSDAVVLDGGSGKKNGSGMAAIPSREEAVVMAQANPLSPVPADRLAREKLVFRSYDSMNVNVRSQET
jgi:hypothetical protein